MQAVINAVRLPSSSEVPSGALDVRQRSDCGLHQERGRHTILHTHADEVTPAELVRSQGDNFGSGPSTRSPQHLGRFPVRVGQTLNMEWMMAMECLRLVFAQWGKPQVDLFATFANRRLIKFASAYPDPRAEFTDALSVPWAMGGASCMPFCHSRWSLKYCRRSLSLHVFSWFWSLLCRKQLHGFRSCWICHKKVPSCSTSRVNRCWLKTSCWPTGWQRLITTGVQIYTHGNSTGHPNGQGPL